MQHASADPRGYSLPVFAGTIDPCRANCLNSPLALTGRTKYTSLARAFL